jgi:transcriptional regulator with GAF, ATPase, and Fis domain
MSAFLGRSALSTDASSALALRLAQWLRTLQRRSAIGHFATLKELTDGAADAIPGADYAAITVVDRKGAFRTVAPTHAYAALLDRLQETHREGPCVAAAWEYRTMRIEDLDTDTRWPRFSRDAVARTPIRSVLSFQLFADANAMGALNFYAERPHAFDERSVEAGLIYAAHTTVAWHILQRDDQFRAAVASRDIIGQAKGMLMERFDINAAQAFELLKRLSQEANTPLVAIAGRMVADASHEEHHAS